MGNKKVLFYDNFDKKNDRWKDDSFSYFNNGKYEMYPRNLSNNFSWISLQMVHSFKNFIYETEVEWVSGRTDAGFGIIFRAKDTNNGYIFSITQNGCYSMGILENKKFEFLLDWKRSKIIKNINNLSVACVNQYITYSINGVKVEEIVDLSFNKGFFGLYSNANIHSKFDNVKIYEIEEELLIIP